MRRFIKWAVRRPLAVIALALGITALSIAAILANLRLVTDLDEYMPQSHPAFVFSDEADERFRIRDAILIAVEHPDSIYNPGTLGKLIRIEEDLAALDEIEETDIRSLHTAENIVGAEDGLEVRDFYVEAPADEAEAARIRDAVRGNDMIRSRLVSADEKSTLVLVDLADKAFSSELYRRVLELAASHEGPETLHVAGRPVVEGSMAILGPRDMARMGPLVILVIALVLLLVLRSLKRAFIALAVVVLSALWTFGLMAGLGLPIYTVTIMIPVMLIAIGVAYGIHLYNHVDFFLREHPGAGAEETVDDTVDSIWTPLLYAGLTTMAGFVSLVTSQVLPVRYFGLFSAFGVLAALLLSMLLIPSGLILFGTGRGRRAAAGAAPEPSPAGPRAAPRAEGPGRLSFGARFADGVVRRPFLVAALTLLVLGLSLLGITKIWINASFLGNFERDSEIARTDAYLNAHFGGTSTLNVILDAESPDAFKDPALLGAMAEAQAEALRLEGVGDAVSLVDYLRRMNMVMNGGDPSREAIPESREMVAQYLLLYEMSGDPDNLWKVVDSDYRGANLTVQLKSDDSKTIGRVVAYFDSLAGGFAERGVRIRYAGSGYKSLVFAGLILNGQVSSLALSVLVVFLLVAFMARSLKLGAVGTIPVLVAIAVNFGAMGLLNLPLTTSTALISSIAVGIGVDYAIHFIERYRERLGESGDATEAARFAMSHTGRAVLLNATVVIAGFLVLLFSVFPPNRQVGALVSLNMATSLLATVSIMFLVLRKAHTSEKERTR